MGIEIDWNAIATAAGGGSAVLLLCKALITKALRDLEDVTKKVNDALIHLSIVSSKLEQVDKIVDMVHSHEHTIARLEMMLVSKNEQSPARRIH